MKQALSFDDVLLVPQPTYGGSRDEVDLTTTICGNKYTIPIMSANMSSVTEGDMCEAMADLGGIGVLHRMMSPQDQEKISSINGKMWISIEGSDVGYDRLMQLTFRMGTQGICIDVAHADSPTVINTVIKIRKEFPWLNLIVGNYATPQAIDNLLYHLYFSNLPTKNIAFKVGIGSGSQCTTRIVTGCGLPTLESLFMIEDYFKRIHNHDKPAIIADGGIKNSGDIVKALAAGADAVMLGGLLAGTKEAPGNVIKHKGHLYKVYRGSASYGQKFDAVGHARFVEGEETLVPYKGSVTSIIDQLVEGVKSGFSYCGAKTIRELRYNAEFVQITQNGYRESLPHGAL